MLIIIIKSLNDRQHKRYQLRNGVTVCDCVPLPVESCTVMDMVSHCDGMLVSDGRIIRVGKPVNN